MPALQIARRAALIVTGGPRRGHNDTREIALMPGHYRANFTGGLRVLPEFIIQLPRAAACPRPPVKPRRSLSPPLGPTARELGYFHAAGVPPPVIDSGADRPILPRTGCRAGGYVGSDGRAAFRNRVLTG